MCLQRWLSGWSVYCMAWGHEFGCPAPVWKAEHGYNVSPNAKTRGSRGSLVRSRWNSNSTFSERSCLKNTPDVNLWSSQVGNPSPWHMCTHMDDHTHTHGKLILKSRDTVISPRGVYSWDDGMTDCVVQANILSPDFCRNGTLASGDVQSPRSSAAS